MAAALPKQYIEIDGLPIIHHTLARICNCNAIEGVWAGLICDDVYWAKNPFVHDKFRGTFKGGERRQTTVLNGLHELSATVGVGEQDWVVVHDAVRPAILQHDLSNLIDAARVSECGVVMGAPIADTLKMIDASNNVISTQSRESLWQAMTPQIFRLGELNSAIMQCMKNDVQITDESMAMELAGFTPKMIQGSAANIKVTVPSDIGFIKNYWQATSGLNNAGG